MEARHGRVVQLQMAHWDASNRHERAVDFKLQFLTTERDAVFQTFDKVARHRQVGQAGGPRRRVVRELNRGRWRVL